MHDSSAEINYPASARCVINLPVRRSTDINIYFREVASNMYFSLNHEITIRKSDVHYMIYFETPAVAIDI